MKFALCLLLAVALGLANARNIRRIREPQDPLAPGLPPPCPIYECYSVYSDIDFTNSSMSTEDCLSLEHTIGECIKSHFEAGLETLCGCPEEDLYYFGFYDKFILPEALMQCGAPECNDVHECIEAFMDGSIHDMEFKERKDAVTACVKVFHDSPCTPAEVKLHVPKFATKAIIRDCPIMEAIETCDEVGELENPCDPKTVDAYAQCLYEEFVDYEECGSLTKKGAKGLSKSLNRHFSSVAQCKKAEDGYVEFIAACGTESKRSIDDVKQTGFSLKSKNGGRFGQKKDGSEGAKEGKKSGDDKKGSTDKNTRPGQTKPTEGEKKFGDDKKGPNNKETRPGQMKPTEGEKEISGFDFDVEQRPQKPQGKRGFGGDKKKNSADLKKADFDEKKYDEKEPSGFGLEDFEEELKKEGDKKDGDKKNGDKKDGKKKGGLKDGSKRALLELLQKLH